MCYKTFGMLDRWTLLNKYSLPKSDARSTSRVIQKQFETTPASFLLKQVWFQAKENSNAISAHITSVISVYFQMLLIRSPKSPKMAFPRKYPERRRRPSLDLYREIWDCWLVAFSSRDGYGSMKYPRDAWTAHVRWYSETINHLTRPNLRTRPRTGNSCETLITTWIAGLCASALRLST